MTDHNMTSMVGRLTRDPELQYTANGTALCKISIANNEAQKGADGKYTDAVSYFDCAVWGTSGLNLEKYCRKGNQILVEGRFKQETWTDKVSGQKRSKITLRVTNWQNLTPRDKPANAPFQQPNQQTSQPQQMTDPWQDDPQSMPADQYQTEAEGEDDIPF